jgi:hypothetical protein
VPTENRLGRLGRFPPHELPLAIHAVGLMQQLMPPVLHPMAGAYSTTSFWVALLVPAATRTA